MDPVQKLIQFCFDKRSAIGYSFMALLTMGGQQWFSFVAFQCPCSHENLLYGFVFLFAPALVLLIIGYFLNTRTWKLFTGCCLKPKRMFPKGNPFHCLLVFTQLTLNAFIAPVMWISVALLHGSFYACAMSGWQNPGHVDFLCKYKSELCHKQLFAVTCGNTSMPSRDSKAVLQLLHAQSQFLGWWLIMTAALISLLNTCYSSCRSKVSALQLKFWRLYLDKEKEKFDKLAQEYAAKLAERNLRSFFENKEPEDFALPSNMTWDEISSLHYFIPDQQYYSTLHRFVEHGKTADEKETMPDFVDE
ncbi:hypothetical protein FKM82_010969 [Ascaphus truei]